MVERGAEKRLFSRAVVAGVEDRFESLPAAFRPLLWEVAVQDSRAVHREWIEAEFERLSDRQTEMRSVLLDHNRFGAALAELAVLNVLHDAGLKPQSGPEMASRTPDVLLPGSADVPPVIFEVWRRSVPETEQRKQLQWVPLARAVEAIPRPVALAIHGVTDQGLKAPSRPQMKSITHQLRSWLLGPTSPVMSYLDVPPYRFVVVAEDQGGALRATLLHPKPPSAVTADDVIAKIREKTTRYRHVAAEQQAALVIVLAAEAGASLDREVVAATLRGKNVLSMSIDMFGTGPIEGRPVPLRPHEAPPIFNPALSAVAWVDVLNGQRPTMTLWPLTTAAIAVPRIPTDRLDVEVL